MGKIVGRTCGRYLRGGGRRYPSGADARAALPPQRHGTRRGAAPVAAAPAPAPAPAPAAAAWQESRQRGSQAGGGPAAPMGGPMQSPRRLPGAWLAPPGRWHPGVQLVMSRERPPGTAGFWLSSDAGRVRASSASALFQIQNTDPQQILPMRSCYRLGLTMRRS
eukprot:COSAG01_NODE_3499_length_6004_cov_2.645047_11_plen_164_part_00